MSVSKRLRYEVLRRDGHTCRYCGAKAPDVEITVDHVVPVALGGKDEASNLVAACRPCNNGKTSSSPDAALVDDVSESAVQWAAAMKAAAARMLADIKGRQADRELFREWWNAWGVGEGKERHTIPLDPDWESTVDQFLAAGLPMEVLKTCLNSAMRRKKIISDHKFRYMCGIAWRKVSELRETAQSIASGREGSGTEEEDDPDVIRGRADLAAELLGRCDEEEREELLAEAREDRGAETRDEQHIEAIHIAWEVARVGLEWLVFTISEYLLLTPDEETKGALQQARAELYDENGEDFSKQSFVERVLSIATRAHELRSAREYLESLPAEEHDEWIAFANAAYGGTEGLSGYLAVTLPAECARDSRNRRSRWGMCQGPGDHIRYCTSRATRYLRFDELGCCQNLTEEHNCHSFCERHAEMAIAGGLRRNGEPVSVLCSTLVNIDPAEMAVPF